MDFRWQFSQGYCPSSPLDSQTLPSICGESQVREFPSCLPVGTDVSSYRCRTLCQSWFLASSLGTDGFCFCLSSATVQLAWNWWQRVSCPPQWQMLLMLVACARPTVWEGGFLLLLQGQMAFCLYLSLLYSSLRLSKTFASHERSIWKADRVSCRPVPCHQGWLFQVPCCDAHLSWVQLNVDTQGKVHTLLV